jgi:hypothetical protein
MKLVEENFNIFYKFVSESLRRHSPKFGHQLNSAPRLGIKIKTFYGRKLRI